MQWDNSPLPAAEFALIRYDKDVELAPFATCHADWNGWKAKAAFWLVEKEFWYLFKRKTGIRDQNSSQECSFIFSELCSAAQHNPTGTNSML